MCTMIDYCVATERVCIDNDGLVILLINVCTVLSKTISEALYLNVIGGLPNLHSVVSIQSVCKY